jgi:transcriptional regulator with PAS, ATPase and Fis domain
VASVVRKAPIPATSSDAVLAPLDYQIEPLLPFAATDLSIHLRGETGVGKDVVARALHDLSGRRGSFVALNCAAIPDNLFESELFGYVRGAFSGAVASHRGQIAAAEGGTLFLDEIGELSLPMQAKLLRVLEQKEVWPVGASAPVRVNFRLVSATLCDLEEMIALGRFRRDLYGRLGRTFVVPPLREHREHLGRFVRSILVSVSKPAGQVAPVRFKIEAARAIVGSAWPLNIRELKHCIESAYAAAMAAGMDEGCCVIKHEHLPRSALVGTTAAIRQPRAELHERKIVPTEPKGAPTDPRGAPTDDDVVAALQAAKGNRSEAARILGVTERTVFRRIGRLRKDGREL